MIDWNPLVAAVATLLLALAMAVPGILAWLSAKRVEAKTDTVIAKADLITEKATEIHAVTNSAASKAAEKIDGLERRVSQLVEQLAEKRQDAALLAQSAATAAAAAKPDAPA